MSSEDHKVNKDQISEIIIYTKSKQVSSQSNSSEFDSKNIPIQSRNKNKEEIKNTYTYKSDIKSLKSSRVINNSNISINSVMKLKNKNLKKKRISLKSKKSEQSLNEELPENEIDMNCRQMIKRFFESNNRINYVQNVIYIISLLSFAFYVVCTYMPQLFKYLNYIDYFICPIYMIAHLINFLISHQPLNYLTSGDSIIFFILEILPLFSSLCKNFHLNWLFRIINISRVVRILKGMNLIEIFIGKEINDVTNQIITIISNLLVLVLLLGGSIQIFDLGYVEKNLQLAYDTLSRKNLLLRREFHHYLYFSVVTLTTVGYGDIMPKEILSKVTVMIISIFMLFYVPQQIDKLLTLLNNQTIYERKRYIFTENVPFVVLIGDIQLESLKSFCQEYFHKDHGDNLRQIVILMNAPPSKSMEHFLNYKENSKFITYLQGKYTNDQDLIRAGILHSKSCIIFTDKKSLDPHSADLHSLILSLSIKKFFFYNFDKRKKSNFKICLQLNKQDNCQNYFIALQDKYKKDMPSDILLVIESLKMNLLSKSCLTPGIISLISNLVISSGTKKISSVNESDWMKEYVEGQQYEIYKYNNIKGELLFLSFQGIAQELYMKFHAILIALEIIYKGGILVKLNPQSKENIIDIIYLSLFSKTKNTSLKDGFNNNQEERENDSILDIYDGSDEELDNNNYKKKYNLNFKHLEINIYCISSDESIIGNIKRLDDKKDNNLNKSESVSLKQNTFNIYSPNKKSTLTRQMTRIRFESDGESDFDNEDIENNSVKNLIEIEDNQESYEEELLKDYYTLDDIEKNDLYSNGLLNQGINDHNDIRNHIVICGMHPELIQFILPLRSKNLPIKLLKWIVILTPNLPQEIHDTLSKFPKIIFIQGDPLYSDDLMRANIITADIAIILGNYSNLEKNENDNYEIIGKENEINNEEKKEENKSSNDNDDLMEDCKVLYIYKAIKRLNSSIQIITELLHMNNIELLLSAKSLKKLYKDSKNVNPKNNPNQTQISDENDYNSNLNYDLTPVYAAGEVYIPTVIDRITSQISYNSNLLTILNLILIGERPPEKATDKKLAQMIELPGSNLYLIQCEQRNESYNDMFKRLLIKYNMISIALYRKNEQNDFYYVYTNPKKTTLVKKNDFVFVLSSKDNLISYYEKNLFLMNIEGKSPFDNEDVKNSINIGLNEEHDANNDSPPFSKIFQEAIEQQIKKNGNGENSGKVISIDNINNSLRNLFGNNKEGNKKYNFNKNEIKRGKYSEIDNMQNRLDKGIEKLKLLNDKCNNIKDDIEKFVKEEISSEFSVYLSNSTNLNQDMK